MAIDDPFLNTRGISDGGTPGLSDGIEGTSDEGTEISDDIGEISEATGTKDEGSGICEGRARDGGKGVSEPSTGVIGKGTEGTSGEGTEGIDGFIAKIEQRRPRTGPNNC